MKLPYFHNMSDCRAPSQTQRASARRSDSKCHWPAAAPSKYLCKIHRSLFPPSRFSTLSSILITSLINNSNALNLYNIIMKYISPYRRLCLDKRHAPVWTRHQNPCCYLPSPPFLSSFHPSRLISDARLCSFASILSHLFFFLHQLSFSLQQRKWAWSRRHGSSYPQRAARAV